MMKPLFTALLLLAGSTTPFAVAADPVTTPKPPPHTLAGTELRVVSGHQPGRQYQLHIALPASFATSPEKRYPVLFVTDGYWDFPNLVSSYSNLIYDKVVPECLIVGLGYAGENLEYGVLRNWDLSPAPVFDQGENSGHAAEFLQLIEQEIIPLVEREYRGDPRHRVLAGSSLGGLFTLYAMLTKPELFEGYIAASPATGVANEWLFAYEEQFAKTGRAPKGRLFMTGAENEWPKFLGSIKRFDERLRQRHYAGLAYSFRLIDGERHAGTKAESYVRGLRYVLAPLAPETGPMKDE